MKFNDVIQHSNEIICKLNYINMHDEKKTCQTFIFFVALLISFTFFPLPPQHSISLINRIQRVARSLYTFSIKRPC